MDISVLEPKVLGLPVDDRARLVRELLKSLDRLPPRELDRLWLAYVGMRLRHMDERTRSGDGPDILQPQ
jgi:Putative addiction module component